MNVVKEIQNLNALELARGTQASGSWHDQYKNSAYIFIGGFPYDLTEGDIICVFSQFGEVIDLNLARDKETGKSKGFAFLAYEDQRSTVLAVDNFNGTQIKGRTIRVDHTANYKPPKIDEEDPAAVEAEYKRKQAILPPHLRDPVPGEDDDAEVDVRVAGQGGNDADAEDPMAQYLAEKRARKESKHTKKEAKRAKKESKRDRRKQESRGGRDEYGSDHDDRVDASASSLSGSEDGHDDSRRDKRAPERERDRDGRKGRLFDRTRDRNRSRSRSPDHPRYRREREYERDRDRRSRG